MGCPNNISPVGLLLSGLGVHQDYVPGWLGLTRVTQLRFLRSHPELLEGLLDVINTPHGQIRQFNSAVLVRLWCAMVRSTCARGVRAALAGNESDSALRRAQFAQHGEERFCLPNRDQLECNAHVVNWAGAYAQLLDHTHVPASPAYKEVGNDGAVVRVVGKNFAVGPEGYRIRGAYIVHVGKGMSEWTKLQSAARNLNETQIAPEPYSWLVCAFVGRVGGLCVVLAVRPPRDFLGPVKKAAAKGCSCKVGGCVAGKKCKCAATGCTSRCACAGKCTTPRTAGKRRAQYCRRSGAKVTKETLKPACLKSLDVTAAAQETQEPVEDEDDAERQELEPAGADVEPDPDVDPEEEEEIDEDVFFANRLPAIIAELDKCEQEEVDDDEDGDEEGGAGTDPDTVA